MPKIKERESEKTSKNGAKTSARTPAKAAAKTADRALESKASAKVAVKSNGSARVATKPASAKLPVVKSAVAAKPAIDYRCPFNKDELLKWRQVLLSRRSEISSDIAGLEKDAMEAEDGHTTPNHIAERGSDADLQDVSLGIAGEEKDIIWQIDRALRKIDKSSPIPFGLCEYTKEPISRNRLQLIPWTPLSIEGATHMEQNNLTVEDLLADE
jgi:RNA polymerase-binding transcription factor DksA